MTADATAVPSELFNSRFPMRQALSMTVPMPTWDMLLTRCWLAAVLLHNELCVREHALLCFVCVLRRGTLARNIKVAFCRSLKVQVHFQLAARSMLHVSACASHARGSTLHASLSLCARRVF